MRVSRGVPELNINALCSRQLEAATCCIRAERNFPLFNMSADIMVRLSLTTPIVLQVNKESHQSRGIFSSGHFWFFFSGAKCNLGPER